MPVRLESPTAGATGHPTTRHAWIQTGRQLSVAAGARPDFASNACKLRQAMRGQAPASKCSGQRAAVDSLGISWVRSRFGLRRRHPVVRYWHCLLNIASRATVYHHHLLAPYALTRRAKRDRNPPRRLAASRSDREGRKRNRAPDPKIETDARTQSAIRVRLRFLSCQTSYRRF